MKMDKGNNRMLSSRERVLMSLNHEKPDRAPVDIWAEESVWDRLVNDLGVSSRDDVCKACNVDVRWISPVYPEVEIKNGIWQNIWGERLAKANTLWGEEWNHIDGALANAASLEDLEKFPWPTCDLLDYSMLGQRCDKNEGYAIAYGDADIFERPAIVRGIENMLCDTVLHPDWVEYLRKVFLDFFVEDFIRAMESTGGRIDIYRVMTDLGTQDGLLLSMDMFEKFIAPSLKVLIELAHKYGVKVMFHTCGAVREAIPRLIELGVDILNPIQPVAKGMGPQALKKDFGKDLCFHGGIDIQYLLPLKSVDDILCEVKRCVEILGSGGGYIMAPSHNLQPDTSTENILAAYDMSLR